ncbi:MAG: DNA-binding protein [Synergistetes bacterium]|nr:DNA-binding protein [Synergistota bacterium]
MKEEVRTSSVECKGGRLIVGRILPGTDLIEGVLNICRKHGLESGSIDVMLGSLRKFTFVYAVKDETKKLKTRYCEPVSVEGPLEFLCGNGIIGKDGRGEVVVHLHGIVSDERRKIHAGHIVKGGNPVLATIELVIRELPDIEIRRELDEETEFPLFKFNRKRS